ncbi:TRAP transporter small permease [Cupriavidus sp. TA19]|uniref:TRAP transporter small permease n=1 Tax=Cupriavidus sp. TA19 TaxID=701108 RepID=UPI00295F55A8|nr:TRAP transporter small permease [Cupriavidus sp. TA19]
MQHASTSQKRNVVVIAAEAFMALGLAVMLVLVLGNVVLRYGFNSGIASSEDIARFLFIWIIFTGAALGIRENTHLGMDSVVKMLPRKGKVVLAIVSHALMLATAGFLLVGSWQQMEFNKDTTALGAVPYPLSWVYAAGVYGSLAIGFLVAANLKRILSGRLSDDELVMVKDAEGLQEAEQMAAQAASLGRIPSAKGNLK